MDFRIADTLVKLIGEKQRAVDARTSDPQMNPTNPGITFHKMDGARNKHFCSVRVSDDIQMNIHKRTARESRAGF